MAVVTHGSFDEGPIVLALPPTYEYADAAEVDPVFMAWNRSTGITISASQVTDFSSAVATETSDFITDTDLDTISIATSGTITASNITGTNTGDSSGHTGLVPYSGATGDVNLGSNDLYADHLFIGGTITDTDEAVSKGWVEALVGAGTSMQKSIIDFVAAYANLPGNPSDGDRYITSDTESIWEYETNAWVEHVPSAGWQVWCINDAANYTFDGNTWLTMAGSINHNDTLNKEGGGGGHWYHLSAAQAPIVDIITDETTIADPTGLHVNSKGTTGNSAWVELHWNAATEDNLDHYIVYYKRSDLVLWGQQISYTNTATIYGLIGGLEYDFAVAAVTKLGNVSNMSAEITEEMSTDNTVPATVSGVTALGCIQAVLLKWTHNSLVTDPDLDSYNIYRSLTNSFGSASKVGNIKANAYMDSGLPKDTLYYYWVLAVDFSGNESVAGSSVNATTRNVEATDVENIAADQVIIQGLVTLASWKSPGVTTIDGAQITTNTITLEKIDFISNGGNIVAEINANAQGVQLAANVFNITGATIFTAKENGTYVGGVGGATLSRISIYPDVNTGIKVTDDLGRNVFECVIGGTNIGDVTIGNYTGGQGIQYDRSTGITTFRGAVYASSGSISGVLDFGTATGTFGGKTCNIAISGNEIWENAFDGDNSMIAINYRGFAGGTTHFRSTVIYNGKNRPLLVVGHDLFGVTQDVVQVIGPLVMTPYSGVSYFMPPIITTTERNALVKSEGMIVYDWTIRRFVGCVKNNAGVEEWHSFSISNGVV